jgi:hypothetical protein
LPGIDVLRPFGSNRKHLVGSGSRKQGFVEPLENFEMHMRVVEPGHQRSTAQVPNLRPLSGDGHDILPRPDGKDTFAGDRDRFGDVRGARHRPDHGIGQDDDPIGRRDGVVRHVQLL